jgi:hypothetical protein
MHRLGTQVDASLAHWAASAIFNLKPVKMIHWTPINRIGGSRTCIMKQIPPNVRHLNLKNARSKVVATATVEKI